MPYIKQQQREKWEESIKDVVKILKNINSDKLEGEINYFITSILLKTYKQSYFEYNRAIGVLECIKQELYRKQVASYEDEKIKENGEV